MAQLFVTVEAFRAEVDSLRRSLEQLQRSDRDRDGDTGSMQSQLDELRTDLGALDEKLERFLATAALVRGRVEAESQRLSQNDARELVQSPALPTVATVEGGAVERARRTDGARRANRKNTAKTLGVVTALGTVVAILIERLLARFGVLP